MQADEPKASDGPIVMATARTSVMRIVIANDWCEGQQLLFVRNQTINGPGKVQCLFAAEACLFGPPEDQPRPLSLL
jgi:hypothetical protein